MDNRIGKNRKSPANEADYIAAYLQKNPSAKKADGMDVAAVIAKDGTRGHGLLSEEFNRSHDKNNHIIKDFIPDNELKKPRKEPKIIQDETPEEIPIIKPIPVVNKAKRGRPRKY